MSECCATHPDTRAVGHCAACSRPLCSECRVVDLASERAFCSPGCRDAYRRVGPGIDADFSAGLRSPLSIGWRLALRNAGAVSLRVGLPIGLVFGSLRVASATNHWGGASEGLGVLASAGALLPAVGVLLSSDHTGSAIANPWPQVARRVVPWAATWTLTAACVALGSLLLVIPGVVASIRLFWADEFALLHGHGPRKAIRESIELTRGLTGRLFILQTFMGIVFAPFLFAFPLLLLAVGASGGHPIVTLAVTTAASVLLANLYAIMHGSEVAYFYGLRALRAQLSAQELRGDWVERALRGTFGRESERLQVCPSCGTAWNPEDYRRDAEHIHCSYCKAELERPGATTA